MSNCRMANEAYGIVSDILVGQNATLSRGPRNEFHNSPAVIFCEGG